MILKVVRDFFLGENTNVFDDGWVTGSRAGLSLHSMPQQASNPKKYSRKRC